MGENENIVYSRQRIRTMRDNHHNGTSLASRRDGICQRRLAFRVEAGIWLIQNDQKRFSKEGACKSYSLTLASGKSRTAVSDPRIISFRHRQDEVMHIRQLCCLDDVGGINRS